MSLLPGYEGTCGLLPEQCVKHLTAVPTNTISDKQEINHLCDCELACVRDDA